MATIPSYYEGLLSEDDMSSLRNQALASGLLRAGAEFSRAGAPSTMPQGSGFSEALQGFQGGYQGTVDSALQNMLKATQVQEMVRKQKEAQQLKQLYASAATPKYQTIPGVQTPIPSDVGFEYPAVTQAPATQKLVGYDYDLAKIIPMLQASGQFGAIKDIADSMKSLRQLGLMGGGQAPSPFAAYTQASSPQVRALAGQLEQGFKTGVIDEETAYKRLDSLAKMEDSFVSRQIASGERMDARQAAAAERADRLAQDKKPTEGEKKTATLAGRLEGALGDLNKISTSAQTPEIIPSLLQKLSFVPGAEMAAGKVSSSERLRAEAAQLDALDAALTLGTGAAYTSEQLKGYAKAYFPQIGDTPDVIQDKNNRFARIVTLAREQSGAAGKSIDIARGKAKTFDIKDFKEKQGLE
jgi:hypothetical protein